MQKYGLPVLVGLIGGLIVRLADSYINITELTIILRVFVLFAFGLSLQPKHSTKGWVKKLVIAFVLFFFICVELGYIVFPQLQAIFNFLGVYGFVVYLVYIYCGWLFFT